MTNPTIETDIAEILKEIKADQKEIKTDQKKLLEEINSLKIGQTKLEGKIDILDEKLSGRIGGVDTKVDQLDKRVANQEFTNRGILIGLILALLGSAIKLFGLMPNN